jgi:GTP cyclohydrolase I
MHKIEFAELRSLAANMAYSIRKELGKTIAPGTVLTVYAVPRNGIPAALALAEHMPISLVDTPDRARIVVDDLIDSGATAKRYEGKPFFALIDKRVAPYRGSWIVWPWEGDAAGGVEDNIRRLLQYVGEDATRGGLLETPARVAKAWKEWCGGYDQDPKDVLKTFEDGAEGVDEMVVVKDIPFYTHCEHHMAPFFGTATIGYLPNQKIVGLSKLSRLLDIYARRLQVQERLGCQVADAIMEHLDALGCGVVINARHLCMESRGICKQGSTTTTSALRGLFKDEADVRAEFLALAR